MSYYPDPALLPLQATSGASSFTPFLMIGAIAFIFYFLIFRPQKKREKETKLMLESLKKGDEVTTIGGIRGIVHSLKEKTVLIQVDDNTKMEFNRTAIGERREEGRSKVSEKDPG